MMKKRENKSRAILLGSFIILVGFALPLSKYIYNNFINSLEQKQVEEFLGKKEKQPVIDQDSQVKDDNEIKLISNYSYNYIAVLEIPSISLKRGLVNKNDRNNNVNKNIEILKESNMPDTINGNMILAGHSGNSRISFFRKLNLVKNGDIIYIYYNNVKYIYKVVNIYLEVKDGDISIDRDNNKTTLTLTTCSQEQKGKQLIVISELIKSENY